MAKLKRAKRDGHYYVLAGQSKGTWQVREQGIGELKRYHVALPHDGDESIDLPRIWWRYLWQEGFLFTHGIITPPRDGAPEEIDGRKSDAVADESILPLLLQLAHDPQPGWSLALDLTAMPGAVLAAAQRAHAAALVLYDRPAMSLPWLQLQRARCLMPILPQVAPYSVGWVDHARQLHPFDPPSLTPALSSAPQGNVFAQNSRHPIWQRCLPGNSVTFAGMLYWIARSGEQPGWPGPEFRWDEDHDGWQLWRLTTDMDEPLAWQTVAAWLQERQLRLTRLANYLDLATPPVAVSSGDWTSIRCNQSLIVACATPERASAHLRQQLQLAVTRIERDQPGQSSSADQGPTSSVWTSTTEDTEAGKTLFARWKHPLPGEYRLQLRGEVMAAPLLVQVLPAPASPIAPIAFGGLACALMAADQRVFLSAFAEQPPVVSLEDSDPSVVVTAFSAEDLAQLAWELTPEGLPVHVRWRDTTFAPGNTSWMGRVVTSAGELTRCWQEDIWPSSLTGAGVSLHLDATSFGRISCTIVPAMVTLPQPDQLFGSDERAELMWLARCSTVPSAYVRVPLPGGVLHALEHFLEVANQAGSQADISIGIATTLALLRAQHAVPAWVLPRLRRLLCVDHDVPREQPPPPPTGVLAAPRARENSM